MSSFTLSGVYILVRKPDLPFSLWKSYFFIFPQFFKSFNFAFLTFIWPFLPCTFSLTFLFLPFALIFSPFSFSPNHIPAPSKNDTGQHFSHLWSRAFPNICTVYTYLYLDTQLEISTTMRSSQCNYLWKVHLSYLAVDCSAELSKYGKMFLCSRT